MLIYRWVDMKAAASYLRNDGMKARHCHYLPAALSNLPHGRRVRGLSFGLDPDRWSSGVDTPVCFVLDSDKVLNRQVRINGQAIYVLTQQFEYTKAMVNELRSSASDHQMFASLRKRAIEDSRNDPDEVFVVGDLADLRESLVEIRCRPLSGADMETLTSYAEQAGVPLIPTDSQGPEEDGAVDEFFLTP